MPTTNSHDGLRAAREQIAGLPSACHDHEGLYCDNAWHPERANEGHCSLLDADEVLGVLDAALAAIPSEPEPPALDAMVEIERLVHAGLTAGETIRRARAALAATNRDAEPDPPALDAAWAEAEAATRTGPDWGGPRLYRFDPRPGDPEGPYGASASPPGDDGTKGIYAYGPTPAAALRSLAARLTPTSEKAER